MMKNRDCIGEWVKTMIGGLTPKRQLRGNSCSACGNYLLSYSTPIAKFVDGHFEIATRKYSVTTSKQQTYLRFFTHFYDVVEMNEIKDEGQFPWRK